MKPWNKANFTWLGVVGAICICAFFTASFIINYFVDLKGTYWIPLIIMLIPAGYGYYAFYKKYYPKKEDYFKKDTDK